MAPATSAGVLSVAFCVALSESLEQSAPASTSDPFARYRKLTRAEQRGCDGADGAYAREHYQLCCGEGRFRDRRQICDAVAPVEGVDDRYESYPKVRSSDGRVSQSCFACARLVDNFQMALLPRLAERHRQLKAHHSRSHYAKTAALGELEAIVEEEVERICSWPRTHHQKQLRQACLRLVEERSEEIVHAIAEWAREGSYGMHLGEAIGAEVRGPLCHEQLEACAPLELVQLTALDEEERASLDAANMTGNVEERPLKSERDAGVRGGLLQRVTAEGFHEIVVSANEGVDVLLYMYFAASNADIDDTHARLRPKYVRLAQFLDAPASNGSLVVAWMDCILNGIPYPHGAHVHSDTIALYPAYSKGRPSYWHDLRDGDVELHELVGFVFGASANVGTKRHVAARQEAAGPSMLSELGELGDHGLMTFEESLILNERNLKPLKLKGARADGNSASLEKDEM